MNATNGSGRPLPFAGLRVVDLTHVLAGPFASMILADLGAEVYKIEKPGRGDTTRGTPPFIGDASHYFLAVNRNKHSVGIDIKAPGGPELVRELVDRSDVLINNFRPGVLGRYGLGYDDLAESNPGLIYCSITGFGEDGPYRDRAAFDVIVQSMAGLMSVTGHPGMPPARAGISAGDVVSGLYAAQAIGAALFQRERTGVGCNVDVAMFDCLFSFLTYYVTWQQATGTSPGPQGSGHPSMVPGGSFPTADGYVTIAAFNTGFWKAFCAVAGHPEWVEDARFATARDRLHHRDALVAAISEVTRQRTTEEWVAVLTEHDIPHGPVWDVEEAMNSDQAAMRGLLHTLRHPDAGDVRVAAYPVQMTGVRTGVRKLPPDLGQDTEAVLREVLGLEDTELEALRGDHAIA